MDYNQVFTFVLFYTIVYNTALLLLFLTLNQFMTYSTTTTFSLYTIPHDTILNKNLLISFFSMAGVPPFLGFFSKLSIFVILTNSFFMVFFILFFVLLFTGLYFYIQNIRLLLTSSNQLMIGITYIKTLNTRFTTPLLLINYFLTTFLLIGFVYLEDILLYMSWLLN